MAQATGGQRSLLENLDDFEIRAPRECQDDLGGSGVVYIKTPVEILEEFQPREFQKRLEAVERFRDEFLESPMMTLEPPYNMSKWARVLEAVGADAAVAGRLANLAATDPMAHAEATRILHHLLKPGGPGSTGRPSGWLNSIVSEAEEYLAHWEEWESQRPWTGASRSRPQWRGGGGRWREDPQAPRADEPAAPGAPPHLRPSGASGASGALGSSGAGGSSGSRDGPADPTAAWARYRTPGLESPWSGWTGPSGASGQQDAP